MTTTQLPDTASPSPLEVDLAVLPKVSLHDHLDGGLRVGTVLDLAREAGVEVPADTVEGLAEWIAEHANGESLEKYLQVFALTTAVMQTREQLRRVAREFVEDLVADGVVYGEIRWAPEQHLAGGLSLDEAVEAVQAGLDEAVEAADAAGHVIRVGQLVTAMRHADRAQEIAELAVRHRAASAATELHEAGLDPRVIGLIAEPRVNELLGVAERSARSLRQRDRQFPEPVTRGRLWCEADVVDYLAFKHETSPRPGALHSARVAQREQAQTRGARP